MKRTTCCFSTFMAMGSSPRFINYRFYRQLPALTLMLMLGLLVVAPLAMADTDGDWPEPVYFNQDAVQPTRANGEDNPLLKKLDQKKLDKANPPAPKEKKGILSRLLKRKDAEPPAPTEEQIVKVGPKDPAASPYPIIRLAVPIRTETGVVPPGIYLVKPVRTSQTNPAEHYFSLTRQNQVIFRFAVKPSTGPDEENMEKEGTPSPLSKVDPREITPMKAEVRVSSDLKTLVFRVRERDVWQESLPFPTANDRRHVIPY